MFFDNVSSSGFAPKITLPTRICDTSSTLELRLLTDYLTNRKQYVVFNNHCSDITDIVNGVPQGSILGLLFLVFV